MSGPRLLDALTRRVRSSDALLGRVRLVCVDGPAGSGKTTLAAALADGLRAHREVVAVMHMDDLYAGWSGLSGVWPRVEEQVLAPLAAGRPGRWRRYDWAEGRFAQWHDLPVPGVLVLEGCGSAPRAVDGLASLVVWVEVPAELRLARGLARDGAGVREHWLAWTVAEQEHFAVERTRERADVVVDGTAPFTP